MRRFSHSLALSNTAREGGGTAYGSLTRCLLIGNRSTDGAGGAHAGTLNNCVLYHNSGDSGGGAYGATLNNCTVAGNSAKGAGGGTGGGTLNNCIVWGNHAAQSGSKDIYGGTVCYTCARDGITHGVDGCITNNPQFADTANTNFQLQAFSPCIDAGTNLTEAATDMNGVPRPLDGNNDGIPQWDMGAYEYVHPNTDSDGDWLSDNTELANGTSPILDDTDGDGMMDGAENEAGTDPLNGDSFLGMYTTTPPGDASGGTIIRWSSIAGKSYNLWRHTNLLDQTATMIFSNIVATPPMNTITDYNATAEGSCFYWIELH